MNKQQKIARIEKSGRKVKFDFSGKLVIGLKSFDSVNQAYNFYFGN